MTNGDFATDTDWTKGTGWTISGGSANYDGLQAYQLLRQGTASGVVGKTYLVKYDVIGNSGVGGIYAKFGGVSLSGYNSSNASFEFYVVAVSTDYIRFTPQLDFNGSITNVSVKESTKNNLARVDYDGSVSSLLAEPQRTNLIELSSDFSTAYWTRQTGIVPTYNTTETLSPDGTNNATKFVGTGSTGVYKSSIGVSGNITRSVYLKSVSGATTAVFKDPNALITSVNLTITNQWQRFELIGDNGTALQGLWIDDITSDGLYMWGAQIEEGAYPTSYIPTDGGTVTRVQDQYTKTGISDLINSEEGVLFLEIENIVDSAADIVMISLTDGSSTNRISIFISGGLLSVESAGSGTNLGIYSKALQSGFNKIAIKYEVSNCVLWVNGTDYTDASFAAFSSNTLNELAFNRGDGIMDFFSKVKQLQVFKTVLTPSELQTLTT